MNMQDVTELAISEGDVRTIHDKDNKLIWGRLAYDTKYAGNTLQNGTPTPTNPINVDVVTGEQTVTVSDGVASENYTISLGTVELCKIGDYQDYIYKSGDDWYIHQSIGKIEFNGTESWGGTNGKYSYSDASIIAQPLGVDVLPIAVSNYLTASNYTAIVNDSADNIIGGYYNGGQFRTRTTSFATSNDWKTWLTTHNMTVYYALVTPTDTIIIDNTLISQLNSIDQFLTRYGYNYNVTGSLPLIINQTNL